MSEHDQTLRKALEENVRLRSEREESLREVASTEYSTHARTVERIYWAYALVCVALGVAAINFFIRSYDMKTLIGCAVGLLVLYETTVLMKLWYAISRMKLDVLKEMKLLRFEISRLQEASGVENPVERYTKYEPTRGTSRLERRLWIAACVLVAMAVSSWTSMAWNLGGGGLTTRSEVILNADGSAEKRTECVRQYSSYYRPSSFTLYTPKECSLQVLDASGMELPLKTTPTDKQNRHEVVLTDDAFVDGAVHYTQVMQLRAAATLADGVWTYTDGLRHVGKERTYSITVLTPPGAEVISTDPKVEVQSTDGDRSKVRFEGVAANDVQYLFTVRYELPLQEDE